MQFMQETQNKFMQELMGHVGAGRVPDARGVSLSDFLNAKPLPFASAVEHETEKMVRVDQGL
jgi:hypothetical protein